jgi:hypothetical protein
VAEQGAVVRQHANVEVGHEQADPPRGVGPTDGEVQQVALVSERGTAGLVDAVPPHPEVDGPGPRRGVALTLVSKTAAGVRRPRDRWGWAAL